MKKFIFLYLSLSALAFINSQTLEEVIKKTNNERYPEALNDFKRLINSSPTDGNIYYYYGDCFFKKEEIDSAIRIWNKGYEMDKLSALSYVGRFRVLWMNHEVTAAEAELNKAIELTKGKKLNAKRAEVLRAADEGYIK